MTRPTAYFPNLAYPASWQEHSILGDTNGSLTQLADIPTTLTYSASGAISVTAAASAFAAWPSQGCVYNVTQNELMFYTANSGTALTVPALGRALGGTSLHAGVIADSVRFLEARALGILLNQLIAEVVAMETELRFNCGVCEGRLTLSSGNPFINADQTAKTTIYFSPFKGNRISIYNGTIWKLYTFTEKSIALGTLTNGKNYDVFVYDNAGTLTLEFSAAWASDTARTDALTLQDGIYVKSSATSRRYLGTFRTVSTTTTESSYKNRLLWNYYNRIIHTGYINNLTAHTYATASYRAFNNDAANSKVTILIGIIEDCYTAHLSGVFKVGTLGQAALLSIGIFNTTTQVGAPYIYVDSRLDQYIGLGVSGVLAFISTGLGTGLPGYYELTIIEYGDSGTTNFQQASLSIGCPC